MRTLLLALVLFAAACDPPPVLPSTEPLADYDGIIDNSQTTTDTHKSDLYVRAAEHLKRGESDQALALYRQAYQEYPRDPLGPVSIGATHVMRKEWAPAREAYEQALTINPDEVEAHYGLGCVAFEQGDYAGAIPHLEAALARDADHPPSTRVLKMAREQLVP